MLIPQLHSQIFPVNGSVVVLKCMHFNNFAFSQAILRKIVQKSHIKTQYSVLKVVFCLFVCFVLFTNFKLFSMKGIRGMHRNPLRDFPNIPMPGALPDLEPQNLG